MARHVKVICSVRGEKAGLSLYEYVYQKIPIFGLFVTTLSFVLSGGGGCAHRHSQKYVDGNGKKKTCRNGMKCKNHCVRDNSQCKARGRNNNKKKFYLRKGF
jgi:hypothetical protein